MTKRSSFHFLVILLAVSTFAQEPIRISGIVSDSHADTPLAYSHVGIRNSTIGTVTNLQGEFSILIPPQFQSENLVVSYLGYSSTSIPIRSFDGEWIAVQLQPVVTNLPELIVKAKKKSLLEEAIDAIPSNHDQGTLKLQGFWRASMKDSKRYIQASETAFDIYRHGEVGKENNSLKILKGRISQDSAAFKQFNFQAGISPSGLFRDSFMHSLDQFSDKTRKNHTYELIDITSYGSRNVYVIAFDKKEGSKKNGYKGEILLDVETLAFVKIRSDFSPSNQPTFVFEDAKMWGAIFGLSKSTWDTYHTEINYQLVGDKWYLSHAKYDVNWTLIKKELNESIHYVGDLVITEIQKKNFTVPSKEEFASNKILSNQLGKSQQDFWEDFNLLLPDEDFNQAFEEIEKRNKE